MLELKSEFQSAPIGILEQVLQLRIPRKIVSMISLLLIPDDISTVSGSKRDRYVLSCCVPQGSLLSPYMFNIYIDEQTNRLLTVLGQFMTYRRAFLRPIYYY